MKDDQVLTTRVRHGQSVAAKIEVADVGMTHVGDPRPVTHIRARPEFAESWTGRGQATGVGNIAPVSFFTVVGRMPPILSISLQPRSDGVTLKDTFVNIRDTNEFVINLATIGQADAVHKSAFEFDTGVDEFDALGLDESCV